MHITIITSEFSPYVETRPISKQVVRFARALKQNGHVATVLMPFSSRIDVDGHSLARRLMPIKALVNGAPLTCHRFDGRTSDGIEVLFLDIEGAKEKPADESDDTLFFYAVCNVLPTLSNAPRACITVGAENAGLATVLRQDDGVSELPMIAVLATLDETTEEAVVRSLESSDRIVLNRGRLYAATLDERLLPLKEMLSNGHIHWLALPAKAPKEPVDKLSSKASFQMANRLPVRPEVPLLFMTDGEAEALSSFLTGDVQVAAVSSTAGIDALTDRYPDRLICKSKADLLVDMPACDACICGADGETMAAAMLSGSIPVVTGMDEAVDLEPTLESGSAIVVAEAGPADLAHGLERLVSAYHMVKEFKALCARLPQYACTWQRAAAIFVDLVTEITLEKKRDGQTE